MMLLYWLRLGTEATLTMGGGSLKITRALTFYTAGCTVNSLQGDEYDALKAVIPVDDKYIIRVGDVAFGGNAASTYRMHVGTVPRPTAVFAPGGKPGETLHLRWIGDLAGDFSQQITLPSDGQPEAAIVTQDVHGS